MPLKLAILLPIIVAAVVLLMNHALALKREKKYRAFWANASFAMAVALSSALYLATDPEVPVETRDVILGVLGAALGAAVAIWIGHIGGDWRANAQSPGGPPLMSDKAPLPQPPINAPNNSGIIAPYNSGSITQNQEPPHTPLGLYQSGQSIGRVQSFSVSPDGKQITFTNPHLGGGAIDPDGVVQFQHMTVSCPELMRMVNPNAGMVGIAVAGSVTCSILSSR